MDHDGTKMVRCRLSVWAVLHMTWVFLLAVAFFAGSIYQAMARAPVEAIICGWLGVLYVACSVGHTPYIYRWVETDGVSLRLKRFLSGRIFERRLDEVVDVRNMSSGVFRRAPRNLRAFVPAFEIRFSDGSSVELSRHWLPSLDSLMDVLEPYRHAREPDPGGDAGHDSSARPLS